MNKYWKLWKEAWKPTKELYGCILIISKDNPSGEFITDEFYSMTDWNTNISASITYSASKWFEWNSSMELPITAGLLVSDLRMLHFTFSTMFICYLSYSSRWVNFWKFILRCWLFSLGLMFTITSAGGATNQGGCLVLSCSRQPIVNSWSVMCSDTNLIMKRITMAPDTVKSKPQKTEPSTKPSRASACPYFYIEIKRSERMNDAS